MSARVADKGKESSLFPYQGKEGAAELLKFTEMFRNDHEVYHHYERLCKVLELESDEGEGNDRVMGDGAGHK